MGLFQPTYVDSHTGYRYYSFEQLHLLEIICLCIDMDIPLKKLKDHITDEGTIAYSPLLAYSKEAAIKMQKKLDKKMSFIRSWEELTKLAEKYHNSGQLYTRHIPRTHLYLIPYENSFFEEANPIDIADFFCNFYTDTTLKHEDFLWVYGFLLKYSNEGIQRYFYFEMNKPTKDKHCITLPPGTYQCRQNSESMIENAKEIFAKYLIDSESFIAIETRIFAGKHKVDEPIYELRIIDSPILP